MIILNLEVRLAKSSSDNSESFAISNKARINSNTFFNTKNGRKTTNNKCCQEVILFHADNTLNQTKKTITFLFLCNKQLFLKNKNKAAMYERE